MHDAPIRRACISGDEHTARTALRELIRWRLWRRVEIQECVTSDLLDTTGRRFLGLLAGLLCSQRPANDLCHARQRNGHHAPPWRSTMTRPSGVTIVYG